MTQPSLVKPSRCWLSGFAALAAGISCGFGQGQDSPVKGFLSVEAFELRKEFVMRFDTIADRVGATEVKAIVSGNRAQWEQAIGDWLIGKCPVEVDGRPLEMELDRVHFVRPDPEKGLVVEDRESVPAGEALVGVVFAAALEGPFDMVRVIWEVFPADGSEAIVEAGVRGQRAVRKLTPENAELTWKNEIGLVVPELLNLPPPPVASQWSRSGSKIGAVLGIGTGVVALLMVTRKKRGTAGVLASLAVLLGLGGVWAGRAHQAVAVTAIEADEISYALLRNIYHAFDYRRESDIYDTLARSATGDLLTQIYLEIQRSLQVETQGGARVRVTDVDLRECRLEVGEKERRDAFVADCQWVAVGTVTHWGHTHDRVNRYRARLTVAPVDGRWKLVGLELVSEERV